MGNKNIFLTSSEIKGEYVILTFSDGTTINVLANDILENSRLNALSNNIMTEKEQKELWDNTPDNIKNKIKSLYGRYNSQIMEYKSEKYLDYMRYVTMGASKIMEEVFGFTNLNTDNE